MTKEWGKMTIVQLKEELTQRGLDTNGKKADLISRLDSYVEEKTGGEEDNTDQLISEIDEVTGENGKEEEAEAEGEAEGEAEAEAEAEGEEAEEAAEEEQMEEGKGDEEAKEEEGEGEGEKKEEPKEDNKYPLNVEGRVTYLPWYNNKKIAVPIREQIRHDLTNESKRRSVVMYPVSIADLADATLQEYMDRCIHFHVVFQNDWQFKEKTTDGHIGFYFANASDAMNMAKEMEDWREDVHVKHLEPADNRASLVMEWKGQDPKTSEAVADRMVFVAPLPTDTGEEELQALFPDALRAVIAVDSKGNPKGYGYTEYQNEAGVREAVDKYKGKLELRGEKLFVYKCCKDKPNGLLSDHVFKACQAKIRNLDQAIKRQGRFMNPMEKRNIIKQIRASRQQLNQDMRIREEMGLPLRLSQQREKERRAEREKTREEGGKDGEKKEDGDEDDDGDESKDEEEKEKKPEKTEEKKSEEKRTPSKPSTPRGGGNRNYQNRGGQRGRGNVGQRGGNMGQRGGRFQQNRMGGGGGNARGAMAAAGGMMRGARGGRGFQGGAMRSPVGGRGASIGVIGGGQQRGPGQTADAIDMLIGLSQALKNQLGGPGHGAPAQGFPQGGGGGNFNQGGNYSGNQGAQGGDFDERGAGNIGGNQGSWNNPNQQGGGNWGNKRRAPDDGFGGDWKRGPGYNNQGGNFGGGNFQGGRRQNFY